MNRVYQKKDRRVLIFILATYLSFWIGLVITGCFMMNGASKEAVKVLSILCAWTPTAVFLILFKRLLPDEAGRWSYIKKICAGRHIIGASLFTIVWQSGVFFLGVYVISVIGKSSMNQLVHFSIPSVMIAMLYTLMNGASGEELGWRGFLHFQLTERFGVLTGSVLVGLAWSFWHMPLWFITSGYEGMKLIIYIIAFLVSNISASVIIGISFHKHKNLLLPVIIHYLFNFWAEFYNGDVLQLLSVLAVFYLVIAVAYSVSFREKEYGGIN